MVRFVLAFLIAVLPVHGMGNDAPLKRLLTADEARGWEAVGRLNVQGAGFCTGTLIAPDLVLTAAHCLHFSATGRPVPADRVHFLAGWRKDWTAAHRQARRIAIHPDFRFTTDDQLAKIAADIALVELDRPILPSVVSPFEPLADARPGDEVSVVSYARDRSEVPSLQEPCHLLGRQGQIMILSCDANFGSSGAPVFLQSEGGEKRVVSVITSMTQWNEREVSLGASLAGPLELLINELRSADPVFRAVRPGAREGLPQVGVE